jgi:hypothetical protein
MHLNPCKPFPPVRLFFIAVLTLGVSGWSTCTAIVSFNSCPGALPPPQINSLSPDNISMDAASVLLTVNGSNFAPQSEMLWNGTALPTTFVDSHHLQVTITQQTFESFGVSAGSSVQISIMSPQSATVVGCPSGGTSATLILAIN